VNPLQKPGGFHVLQTFKGQVREKEAKLMDEQLLKTEDVAKILNISNKYVQCLVTNGELACVRISGRIFRFKREDVERFLEKKLTGRSENDETSSTEPAT
jgi:excisionase family DNA binding protein